MPYGWLIGQVTVQSEYMPYGWLVCQVTVHALQLVRWSMVR